MPGMSNDKITIEVDLSRLFGDSDGTTFEDYIAERAARLLVDRGGAKLQELVTSTLEEQVGIRLKGIVGKALAEPIRRTNQYGEPRGEATSLSSLIAEIAREQLTVKVGNSYDRKTSVLEHVLVESVKKELGGELRKAVDEGRATVLAAVKDQAAQVIQEAIARVAR